MFKNEKIFVCEDVTDRETLCKKLSDHGATIATAIGDIDSVHVFNSFNGNLFEEYVKKGVRIIGVQCIQESLRESKPLPRSNHPIFSRILEATIVCGSDVIEERAKLKTLVGYMNGVWVDEVTPYSSFFLATESGSINYSAAIEYNIPIVQPSWVTDCWNQKTLVDTRHYLLPPFSGCTISVTGLSTNTRNSIQKFVTQYGGKYSQQLTRRCTHLLAEKPKGRKYYMALAWGIHVVNTSWLFDSINLQGCVDVSRYEVASELEDPLYMKPSGMSSRFGGSPYPQNSVHTPVARRVGPTPYSTPILIRRHRSTSGTTSTTITPAAMMPSFLASAPASSHMALPTIPASLRGSISLSHAPIISFSRPNFNNNRTNNSNESSRRGAIPTATFSIGNDRSTTQSTITDAVRLATAASKTTTGLDRYRDVFEQLTGLLRMCDDIIQKARTTTTSVNNDNDDGDMDLVSDDETPAPTPPTTANTNTVSPTTNPSEQEK